MHEAACYDNSPMSGSLSYIKPPPVSIIMPAHNAENYIAESIDSVIAQSYENWELIVVNDGSTDHTESILHDFAKQDKRIRYLSQENRKQGAARNKGISESKGDILAFIDADDIWRPDKLEIQLKYFLENKVDLAFTDGYYFFSCPGDTSQGFKTRSGFHHGKEAVELFIINNRIICSSVMVRKSVIETVGGFSLHTVEDYHLWLKLLFQNYVFLGIPLHLVYYRLHEQQETHYDAWMSKDAFYIFAKYLNYTPEWQKYQRKACLIWARNWFCRQSDNKQKARQILSELTGCKYTRLWAFINQLILISFGLQFAKKINMKLTAVFIKLKWI